MKSRTCQLLVCVIVAALGILFPAATIAQPRPEPLDYQFTVSRIDATGSVDAIIDRVQDDVITAMRLSGATPYALWIPVARPADAPFAGLNANQLALMLAWPRPAGELVASLDYALQSVAGVTSVSTKVYAPVYLGDGLNIPTAAGFYVHRDEHYSLENVDQAITLSREAWQTWERFWGVKITGLFREIPDRDGSARLTRIAWYPSFAVWSDTRDSSRDPESARRFAARRQLLIPGSGIAIASDRLLP